MKQAKYKDDRRLLEIIRNEEMIKILNDISSIISDLSESILEYLN
jgi:hypothetical protein